ncbi:MULTISPECIES: MliC family protein [unclassified Neisseria]|uniref:MliC family protein n=1 Tax=unclassified Neisseria TaxID=2623750 RepID=UPI002665F901|nr:MULTISPECIES: MliC family protein [unclassified Neisseria]MDO1510313.1 MliC family protein [Neisseria sp. MVDL19-042950]MDO1516482.1 MliC family protein [Neisseria sp. MVDL18-041461]MDO1563725.1 MliC family protein [Neisseria sp. MVDL20-010259]
MKFIKMLTPVAVALMLAACATESHTHHHDHNHGHDHSHSAASGFSCQNGFTVNVNRIGTDRISLEYGLDDKRYNATLSSSVSGSGERYVSGDKKTEWHEKGGQAFLSFTDRYGNVTETSCQAQ